MKHSLSINHKKLISIKRKISLSRKRLHSHPLPNFRTIKIPLKTILLNSDHLLSIESLVHDINQLIIHTYQFIRLYILYCYHNKIPFPNLDDEFVVYCVRTLGIKAKCGRKPKNKNLLTTLETFYHSEFQPIFNHQKVDLKNKSYSLPLIAIQICTAINNNIQERFVTHLFRFINQTTQDITHDKNLLRSLKNQIIHKQPIQDPMFNEWSKKYLKHIIPSEIQISIFYDLKINPLQYLPCLIYMCDVLEKQNKKLFQCLPLRSSNIPKHITLSTSCITELFCPPKYDKSYSLKHVKEIQNGMWDSFLKMNHKIFKNKKYSFAHQIQTDGISCCLLFMRKDLIKKTKRKLFVPKTPINEEDEKEFYNIEELSIDQLKSLRNKKVIGCDPGKRSLVYMVDNMGHKLRYTSPQRRKESKIKRNKMILSIEKEKEHIIELETKLSEHNSKCINYQKFKQYLIDKNEFNDQTEEFYHRSVWRKASFREYSYGKKSIDKFLNRIKETFGDNLLIGYGNWSRDTQMKNIEPTMGKGLRRLIHKRYETVTVNEYNTSKKCCQCFRDMENYIDEDGEKVYRLLVCSRCVSSENKQTIYRARDNNGAKNMLMLTREWIKNQRRPREFCYSRG